MKQPTLFDSPQRKKRDYTRVSRRKGDRTAFKNMLIDYKLRGHKITMKQLQTEHKVTHFPKNLMPKDIDTIPIEKITDAYADRAYRVIADYNKMAKRKRDRIVMADLYCIPIEEVKKAKAQIEQAFAKIEEARMVIEQWSKMKEEAMNFINQLILSREQWT